jgi:hypothetical protein
MAPTYSLHTTTTGRRWWLTEDFTLTTDKRRAWVAEKWRLDHWRRCNRLPCAVTLHQAAAL